MSQQLKNLTYSSKLIITILFILCLIYIIQNFFTGEYLSQQSAYFTQNLQSYSEDRKYLYIISRIISDSSFLASGLTILVQIMYSNNRIYLLNYLLSTLLVSYIYNLLKLLYHEPRPFMKYPDLVQPKECSIEYGQPSGHCMLNTYIIICGLSIYGNVYEKKKWVLCISVLYLSFVGFSRVHLGMHGLDQIFFGWIFAIFFIIFFRFFLFDYINVFIYKLIYKQYSQFLSFIISKSIFIILILIAILVYENVRRNQINLYEQEIFNACQIQNLQHSYLKFLYNRCLIDSGVIGGFFGILAGILYTKGSMEKCEQFQECIKNVNISKQIIRMFAILVFPGSLFGLFFIIFIFVNYSTLLEEPQELIYLNFIIKMNVNMYLTGFVFIKFSPYILKKFDLDIEGDLFRIKEEKEDQLNLKLNINLQQFNNSPKSRKQYSLNIN